MNKSFTEFLNVEYKYSEENCVGVLKLRDDLYNPMGSIHGGALFALADETGGMLLAHDTNRISVTVDSNIYYLRAVLNTEYIKAVSSYIKKGRTINVMKVDVYDDSDSLLCTGIFTYMFVEKVGK